MTPSELDRIDARIARCHRDLSPRERKAADTLLEHLDDLGTYRAAELAELAGVSKATMSRLFRSLGFEGFDEVREHLRQLRSAGEPRRVGGVPDAATLAAAEHAAVLQAIQHPRLTDVATALAAARRVTIVGWRNSHPVALHLREQLAQARDDVHLAPLPGQTVGEELVGLGVDDVVVVVGFRRRPAVFAAFLDEATRTGATVVLLGDPTAAAHASRVTIWLECPLLHALAFDSYAAPMALVSVLADAVLTARERRERGGRRRTAIATAYQRLGEIE
jgi:DNA-binding MurR/RpiR family transcriptional regulator